MRPSPALPLIAAIALTFCACTNGAINFEKAPVKVKSGHNYTLTWSADDSLAVTIILEEDTGNALVTVETLTTTASGGSYVWTVNSNLTPANDYLLKIEQGSDVNYWGPIDVAAGDASGTSSSTAGSSSSATSISNASPTSSASQTSSTSQGSSTSTRSSATSRSSQPSATSDNAASTSSSASTTSGGLSTGAKAAIGVCVPIGVIAFVLGGYLLGRRGSKVKDTPQPSTNIETTEDPEPMAELDTRPANELWTPHNTHEMEGQAHAAPQELLGSHV